MGATLSGPDTSPCAPGEVRLEVVSFETAGTAQSWYPWLCALAFDLTFSVRRGDRPSVLQQLYPP
jgi:hypothetical protein